MSDYSEEQNKYAKVVAKAWRDDAYRKQLLSNPNQVLSGGGLPVPSGIQVTVTPDSSAFSVNLGLPARPSGVDDRDLEAWAKDHIQPMFCC